MATNETINNSNVSSLISPGVTTTLSTIKPPVAFGDQLKNTAKQKLLQQSLGPVDRIKKEIEKVVKKKLDLEVDHSKKLLELDAKLKAKSINQVEYNAAVANETANYERSKAILQEEQDALNDRLSKILNDPLKGTKERIKKTKEKIKENNKKSKKEKQGANKERREALLKAPIKSITPVLILLITQRLLKVSERVNTLQTLVNKTNDVIRAANTPEKINQARILRDNTLKKINDVQQDIIKISKQLETVRTVITIFGAVVTVLSLIPIPVPPKVPQTIEKASKIVSGLGFAVGVIIPLLQRTIGNIEDIKRQLLPINALIDGKTVASLTDNQLSTLLDSITEQQNVRGQQNAFGIYKGFRFEIKEEQNPRFVVKGNKRHYAIAINRNNREVLKSESSFTLDPQVLVDELKLVIDQRNLQG
jgi:hypothetical protein